MLLGQTAQNAAPANALVLRGVAQQHHARAGIARPLEQLARLRGTQRARLVDHEHRAAIEPIAIVLEIHEQPRDGARVDRGFSSPSVRAASPATAVPITRNPASL